jgi:hypothetical protein
VKLPLPLPIAYWCVFSGSEVLLKYTKAEAEEEKEEEKEKEKKEEEKEEGYKS